MKIIHIVLIILFTLYSSISTAYDGSTTAAVTLAGGIIKAQHTENTTKYKRKNCPVCKGRGWYISGDTITKVPCGYCEPDSGSEVTHPPAIIHDNGQRECEGPQCKIKPFSVLKR